MDRKEDSFHLGVKALIFNEKNKMLLLERHHQSKKMYWDIPGGRVQRGESLMETLMREVKEETGFTIEPLELLQNIWTKTEHKYNYQVFLVIYVCKIKSGKIKIADNETADYGWFTMKEALKLDFLPLNKEIIQQSKNILKKYID